MYSEFESRDEVVEMDCGRTRKREIRNKLAKEMVKAAP